MEYLRWILAGTAMVGLLTFLSDSESKLRTVIFWSMGSFERASWDMLPYPAAALLLALLLFIYYQKQLNILLLGEERAQALKEGSYVLSGELFAETIAATRPQTACACGAAASS